MYGEETRNGYYPHGNVKIALPLHVIEKAEEIPVKRDILEKPIWTKAGEMVYFTCPNTRCRRVLSLESSRIEPDGNIKLSNMNCVTCERCEGHFWPAFSGWETS